MHGHRSSSFQTTTTTTNIMADVSQWQDRDPNMEDEDDDVDENVSPPSSRLTFVAIPRPERCHSVLHSCLTDHGQSNTRRRNISTENSIRMCLRVTPSKNNLKPTRHDGHSPLRNSPPNPTTRLIRRKKQ